MASHHEQLVVWQKAHRLTLDIYAVTRGFPREETYGLVVQLRRAAVAVATNIAEGAARRHRREYMQYVSIARGSASEVSYLLLVAKDLEYIDPRRFAELTEGYNHVSRMLTKMIRALDATVTSDR